MILQTDKKEKTEEPKTDEADEPKTEESKPTEDEAPCIPVY